MELRILEAVQGGGTGIGNAGGQELKTVLDELTIRLDTTFQLTSEQTVSHPYFYSLVLKLIAIAESYSACMSGANLQTVACFIQVSAS
jgi:hypothetical protein